MCWMVGITGLAGHDKHLTIMSPFSDSSLPVSLSASPSPLDIEVVLWVGIILKGSLNARLLNF